MVFSPVRSKRKVVLRFRSWGEGSDLCYDINKSHTSFVVPEKREILVVSRAFIPFIFEQVTEIEPPSILRPPTPLLSVPLQSFDINSKRSPSLVGKAGRRWSV
eukprot:g78543.t1